MIRSSRSADDWNGASRGNSYEEIHCDGLVECAEISLTDQLYPGTALLKFMNTLFWIDKIRQVAGVSAVECAIDVEIDARNQELAVVSGSGYRSFPGLFHGEELGRVSSGRTRFPRYSLVNREEIPTLTTLFERDLWDLIGRNVRQGSFEMEYNDGIPRLVFEYQSQS